MRKIILFFLLLSIVRFVSGQGMIQIKGVVYDADSNAILDSVTIIVKHSSRIIQNKSDGSFSIFIKASDTLIFGLYGYRIKYLCFKDSSVDKDIFNIRVNLLHLKEDIKEVVVNKIRTQREIRRDMQNLAYDYAYSQQRTDAAQSPISAVYEQYSHKARAKRLLSDYEFMLAKNKLIRQLLDIYNKQGIIDLATDQYKDFIDQLNLDWDFLIVATDYQLAVYIKKKAMEWKN